MCKKAIIAMSGGVDSSVAALLMKEKGYTCMGATMKLYQNEDVGLRREHTCCSLDDVEDARSVAYALDMPYYVFNFADRFKTDVIDKFVHSYEMGVTPNPCIDCNRYLKFDKLFQRMVELNYDYVVTGHYAQIDFDENTGRYLLKKAVDHNKDQSYVLWSLTQEQLKHVQFPLGGMEKCEVRALAEAHNFINARKHDSQDICFVQNGSYADFIEQYTGKTYPPGDFVDTDGNVLGQHRGVIRYTIGQRKGLGISSTTPIFVRELRPETNEVVLCKSESLFSHDCHVDNINYMAEEKLTEPVRAIGKIRYSHAGAPCTLYPQPDGTLLAQFDEPQRAMTPGQAAVFYQDDHVLCGGTIEKE